MKKLILPVLGVLALNATADEAQKAKLMEAGQAAYTMCMACHGADGTGVPLGEKKMAPTLAGSKLVIGKPDVFALIILKGIAKETEDYMGVMAPLEAAYPTDEALAAVMTYVRNSFGNTASVVTAADAAKFREQWKDTEGPITRARLEELEKE